MQIDDRLSGPWGELYPCWPTLWLTKAGLAPPSSECFTSQRNNQTIQKVAAREYSSLPTFESIESVFFYSARMPVYNVLSLYCSKIDSNHENLR